LIEFLVKVILPNQRSFFNLFSSNTSDNSGIEVGLTIPLFIRFTPVSGCLTWLIRAGILQNQWPFLKQGNQEKRSLIHDV